MKKMFLFIVLLMFLFGCSQKSVEQNNVKDVVKEDVQDIDVVADVKSELDFNKPFKCVTVVDQYTSTMYMKDNKMRMDTLPADAHAIYSGDLIYSWSGEAGTIMKMSDLQKLSASAGQQYKQPTQQEILNKAKESNSKCEPYAVSDDLFVPPSDVDFKDMAEMLKQIEGYTK